MGNLYVKNVSFIVVIVGVIIMGLIVLLSLSIGYFKI